MSLRVESGEGEIALSDDGGELQLLVELSLFSDAAVLEGGGEAAALLSPLTRGRVASADSDLEARCANSPERPFNEP